MLLLDSLRILFYNLVTIKKQRKNKKVTGRLYQAKRFRLSAFIVFIIAFMGLLYGVTNSTDTPSNALVVADFEHDTTPVDMRKYWPVSSYSSVTNRRASGVLYNKRVTKTNDPMQGLLPAAKAGEVHYSREDFYPLSADLAKAVPGGDPSKDPIAYFNNSWSMVNRPDMSVSEIADSFPLTTSCTSWCASRGQIYPPYGDIVHGRPGGHTLGESYYYKVDVKILNTPNVQTTSLKLLNGWLIYSITRMEKKYNSYTPEYGRHNNIWGAGNGKTYANTVITVLQHGGKDPSVPNGKICPNQPASFPHRAGYTSFWVYNWYAPQVGPIKEQLLWDERSCTGSASPRPGETADTYVLYYIDQNW